MFIEDKKDKVFIPQTQNTITANDYNQIKNEIQNAIELAGMTPEKDVIQLPQALKTLTQQSGAEEVAKIEAAGQEQLNAINTTGQQAVQSAQSAANTATSKAAEAADSAENAAESASTAAESADDASNSATAASSSATSAASSATQAAGSATAASNSAGTANTKAGEAASSASAALTSQQEAASSASSAGTAKTAAETAKTAAQTAQTAAETAQTQAASSASAASGSATAASASAALAQNWAVKTGGAVSGGEYSAKYHAQQAASSASAASTAKMAAQTAQSAAETAKTQAASSASAAANSASAASQSAQECQELVASVGDPAAKDLSNVTSIAASSAVQTALNGKAATDLSNVGKSTQNRVDSIMPNTMDYVVDSYSNEAGNWYRVYKSGRLEQGGIMKPNASVFNTTVTLLKPFADTNYTISLTGISETNGWGGNGGQAIWAGSISTTSFVAHKGDVTQPNTQNFFWRACGQGAE